MSSAGSAAPGAQRLHVRPQLLKLDLVSLHQSAEHAGLGVLRLDHLTQPGVSRAQRGHLIRGRPDIGHEPYSIIAGGT